MDYLKLADLCQADQLAGECVELLDDHSKLVM
jgi:hypothetical protein